LHEVQKRVSITFGSRNEFRREGIEDVSLFQFDAVEHRAKRRVRDAEERVMRVADFDESFPKFSTFSDGAKCDGIADNCHQTLSSGDGSVQ
jgi:hypothetical protein